MKNFIIEISSPIDRENLVAEIWLEDELIGFYMISVGKN